MITLAVTNVTAIFYSLFPFLFRTIFTIDQVKKIQNVTKSGGGQKYFSLFTISYSLETTILVHSKKLIVKSTKRNDNFLSKIVVSFWCLLLSIDPRRIEKVHWTFSTRCLSLRSVNSYSFSIPRCASHSFSD